jgi:hypothetical protein
MTSTSNGLRGGPAGRIEAARLGVALGPELFLLRGVYCST